MDKQKITTNQVGENDKPLKGLQDKGQLTFECADCNIPLLILQLVSTSQTSNASVLTRVVVKCGECGGYSYVQQVGGQFYSGVPSDDMLFNIIEGDAGSPNADVFFEARKK